MKPSLRIVTLNTWKGEGHYESRMRWIADGLVALKPDIVFLQEAFVCRDLNIDTAASLARALGIHQYSLESRRKIRAFKAQDVMSESNLAILSRPGLSNIRHIPLAFCDADPDRWIILADTQWHGLPVRLANTHFTHVNSDLGQRARHRQAKELAQYSAPPETGISLLGGDLNADWDSFSLSALRDLDDKIEPQVEAVERTLLGSSVGNSRPARIIDHLLFRTGYDAPPVQFLSRFTSLNTPRNAAGEFPSDHAALVADISLP